MNDMVYISDPVRDVIDLHFSFLDESFYSFTIQQQLEMLAESLYQAYQAGDPKCAVEISNGHPDWLGKPADAILQASLTYDDMRLAESKLFGFTDCDDVVQNGNRRPNLEFERAVDNVIYGEANALQSRLQETPSLVHETSVYPHNAALLHYLSANGVEIWRQVVPYNAPEIAKILLDAGADRHAKMQVYGGEYETISLVETSAHPAKAGVTSLLTQLFS